jgi:threonylcarbamoyladenosine tRNA methylthiotransferase MtaB
MNGSSAPSSAQTCRLVTLGCKVNQYETQYVKETLEANGYREAAEGEAADLCIVNTCTVTMEGDAKSRQMIRRLHLQQPRAPIVVMGCYATRDPKQVAALPGVTHVIEDKSTLAKDLADFGVRNWPRGIRRFDGHQRAFVKVQDGCILNCSFCIIPSVRHGLRSRPAAEIEEEVAQLVQAGRREIVLTGIHLGHYGIDLSKGKPHGQWCRLWHLLERLDALPGDFRIRLSSLEAAEVRDDLVAALARSRRVVPHLHLCLQSGSDRVLERMRRRYRSQGFRERCRRIETALELPAFSTDVITGFPGETDDDHRATCRLIREVGFSRLHVFSWSPRRGTDAATLPERVPAPIVAARREELRAIERTLAAEFRQKLLGKTLDVLVEGAQPQRPGWVQGLSCRYTAVAFEAYAPALVGKRAAVFVTEVDGELLRGRPIPAEEHSRWALPVVC